LHKTNQAAAVIGYPASFQASTPPLSALALVKPSAPYFSA
jgi:hypothetical protein